MNPYITETYVAMPDGIKLYTRIIVPADTEKCPVVFIRTPYEKARRGEPFDITGHEYNIYLEHGYAVICQHTRGRGDSEGECHPYRERDDGLATLEYIRTLPFYNGEIYLWGGSYLSTVHLSYFSAKPKDIKGAVIDIQTDRVHIRNYRNGCCYKFCNLNWWVDMLKRRYPDSTKDLKLKRPFKTVAQQVFGEDAPEYTTLLMNDTLNDYWKSYEAYNASESIDFPVLFREGWYDFYLEGMFDMWTRLKDETKKKSAFVVGPWGHGVRVSDLHDFPVENGTIPPDHAVEWFDSIREKRDYKYARKGVVTYHSVGGSKWMTENFPADQKEKLRLYFNEDATLSPVEGDGQITYRYDPQKANNHFQYWAIRKASPIGASDDIVSFVSDEITEDTDFFGNIRWHMNVSSSCDDTAFFIRIYFVRDGEAYNLTETITSLSHLNPDCRRDEIQLIDISLPPIGFTLKKGDRIRVDIASNGRIYVPHSNLKCHWAVAPKTRIADNTIHMKDSFIEIFS